MAADILVVANDLALIVDAPGPGAFDVARRQRIVDGCVYATAVEEPVGDGIGIGVKSTAVPLICSMILAMGKSAQPKELEFASRRMGAF